MSESPMLESARPDSATLQAATIRVRFAETDKMGVAHHSSYVAWLEVGRVEWLRRRGMLYTDMEASGVSLAVSALHIEYRTAVTFDDELVVDTRLAEAKSRRVRYTYALTRQPDGALVARGESVHVPTDRNGKAVRLPEVWLERLTPHLQTEA